MRLREAILLRFQNENYSVRAFPFHSSLLFTAEDRRLHRQMVMMKQNPKKTTKQKEVSTTSTLQREGLLKILVKESPYRMEGNEEELEKNSDPEVKIKEFENTLPAGITK